MDGYRTLARLGVLVGLVGIELALASDLGATTGMVGYTQTRSQTVAPPRHAKIRSLAVQLGQQVAAGQLIAELDPTDIDNEIAAAKSARDRARAAVQAAAVTMRRDTVDTARRFETSTERANAELATADANAKTAAAELEAVEREIASQKDLVDRHLSDATLLKSLELRRASLAKQVSSTQKVLDVLHANLSAATRRTAGLDDGVGGAELLAPLEAELRGAELHIEQLERERTALSLHAPVDGVIEQLPLHPGELAGPDVPVATIVASDTTRVIACVPESRASSVEVGLEAELVTVFDRRGGTGVVESLTSEIAPLPSRCIPPGSRATLMGRLAVVVLDGSVSSLPGQTHIVRFHARRRPPSKAAATRSSAASSAIPSPASLHVPAALLARTRFEPSGLVWVPALDRFLVVSDDTGFEGRDEHAPWVFAMRADGTVDPDPVPIAGVDKLSDLESIALADDGTLWIASSSSTSRKGKRSPARQRLLHVAVRGHSLEVIASTELADLLDGASAAQRQVLGVDDSRPLDIEALAARGGTLYIGLKAPVDGAQRAQIWKVDDPVRLLAGDLAAAGLAPWATAKLTVDADGAKVPAGIADMTFLDATTLALTATASGLDPASQNGALYVVRAQAGDAEARRVREFAGLKPEGVARSADGKKLAIVFDRGAEASMWIELPLDDVFRPEVR